MGKQKPQNTTSINKKQGIISFNFKVQSILIVLISFTFYFNSLFNQYAFDDDIVILKNEYVQRGIKGIPKILSGDVYESFYKQMGAKQELSGGRYRPLSVVTYAIENEFAGDNSNIANLRERKSFNCWDKNQNKINDPEEDADNNSVWNEADCKNNGAFLRHFVNVLLYILCVLAMFSLFRNHLFKNLPKGDDLAFIVTLLFAIHPIHTEVVANVKSRDEIMSLLFICLTFIYSFKYLEEKKTTTLIAGLLCYFLALLSKEYGVTLLALLPISFYVFKNYSLKESIKKTLPFLAVFTVYALIRIKSVGAETIENKEILNNPYLWAEGSQKLATKIFVLAKYFWLCIFPHPLTADYSFNHIPYRSFADVEVWLSLVLHISLVIAGIILFKRKNLLAFAIFFYLFNLALVSNLFFDIGATMGERLIFHSSVGFCIAAGFFILKGIEKLKTIKQKQLVLGVLFVPVILLCGFKTIERNAAWKNDITLFTTDVNVSKNSIIANGNAGARYIDMSEFPENKGKEKELIIKATGYLKRSLDLHPGYVNGYLNLGLAYYKLDSVEKAEETWLKAQNLYPNNPNLLMYLNFLSGFYINKGFEESKKGNSAQAIAFIEKASQIAPNNPETWYNLGGVYFTYKNFGKAKEAWEKTLQLNPNHEMARKGLAALQNIPK